MQLNNQRLPLILALAAGAAMLGTTAWQGYSVWQKESQPAVSTNQNAIAANSSNTPKVPTVNLASLALFGDASGVKTPAVANTENLPETNLRLYLRGVMAADGEFPGSALIEDEKRNTEAYLVGDELPGNATLRSVHPNRIIIERGGKLENLFFPEEDDPSGMTVAANDTPEPARTASPEPSPSPRAASPSNGEQQRREEIRRRLEQLRERLRNNN
ncbi:MAG: general secretion pathway protein GspC [Gammaproteobacteria bacterium]|nr:MAG: general secretion pathway protein GspC [Gammaproteobacteria bacterium]